jgi:hypothetical protein
MNRGVFVMAVVLALVVGFGGSAAVAQEVTVVNVPMKFTVGTKTMEPGKYELRLNDERTMVMLTPAGRGAAVVIPTITRLAAQQPIADGKMVFDKVGDSYDLSEIWLPTEDGFLVKDTKQPHQHHILSAEKKKTF